MSFDGWLDARDSETVAREWAALGAKRVVLGLTAPRYLGLQPEGAALLAAAFLGCSPERFAWFATERHSDPPTWPPPTFEQGRTVARSVLDGDFEVTENDCSEVWAIREVNEGPRGVQHITVDCAWGEMTREGGNGRSTTIVRVFDRSTSRAVSIPLHSTTVWTIGEVDLSPLDLFAQRTDFKLAWQRYEIDAVRGFLAQLAADIDAHFDVSPSWPGGVIHDEVIDNREYNFRVRKRRYRFESGAHAIELDESLEPDDDRATGLLWATVHGLPWGQEINVRIARSDDPVHGVDGWVDLQLSRAQLDAALARLAAVPGIALA